ncbi:MAG TPA: class I SAM-dependent methyltransferase [Holophagaceae bacterium]|nr:class I SAM-dependent methyltransferase [Holophagaceae bacterium]
MSKVDYGLDAPGVVRNLALAGLTLWGLSLAGPRWLHVAPRLAHTLLAMGFVFAAEAGLMVLTSRWGKLKARDRLLACHPWQGGERVLDVGCGRGLLLIGAARRLSTGKVVGLDLWNETDLSGNGRAATEANVAIEGLEARVELVDGNAKAMPFGDAGFDVAVSSLCLHNLDKPQDRVAALAEIVRVLKPGGRVLIQDFRHTADYARELERLGLVEVRRALVNPLLMFPPTWRVEGRKP